MKMKHVALCYMLLQYHVEHEHALHLHQGLLGPDGDVECDMNINWNFCVQPDNAGDVCEEDDWACVNLLPTNKPCSALCASYFGCHYEHPHCQHDCYARDYGRYLGTFCGRSQCGSRFKQFDHFCKTKLISEIN